MADEILEVRSGEVLEVRPGEVLEVRAGEDITADSNRLRHLPCAPVRARKASGPSTERLRNQTVEGPVRMRKQ